MSRLTDLIATTKAKAALLGADLEREFRALSSRLRFGLNFERHRPEAVGLPQRLVRRGDKVRVLPPRSSTAKGDQRLWLVKKIFRDGDRKLAALERLDARDTSRCIPARRSHRGSWRQPARAIFDTRRCAPSGNGGDERGSALQGRDGR